MKKIDFGQTISILANLGVIGGLIFVGMQLQQDRELAVIAGTEASADARRYWAELVTNNSEVWVKGRNGEDLVETEQAELKHWLLRTTFRTFSFGIEQGS